MDSPKNNLPIITGTGTPKDLQSIIIKCENPQEVKDTFDLFKLDKITSSVKDVEFTLFPSIEVCNTKVVLVPSNVQVLLDLCIPPDRDIDSFLPIIFIGKDGKDIGLKAFMNLGYRLSCLIYIRSKIIEKRNDFFIYLSPKVDHSREDPWDSDEIFNDIQETYNMIGRAAYNRIIGPIDVEINKVSESRSEIQKRIAADLYLPF